MAEDIELGSTLPYHPSSIPSSNLQDRPRLANGRPNKLRSMAYTLVRHRRDDGIPVRVRVRATACLESAPVDLRIQHSTCDFVRSLRPSPLHQHHHHDYYHDQHDLEFVNLRCVSSPLCG